MAKQNILIEGRNIYFDRHNRPVYYVKSQKRGYRISSDMEKQFKTLNSRLVIAVIMFIFLYLIFNINIYISAAASLAGLGFLEYRFRKLLSNCTIIENFEPKKDSKTNLSTDTSVGGLVLRMVLYLVCGVLLIANAYTSPELIGNVTLQAVSDIVGIAAIYFGLRYAIVLHKKITKK